MRIARFLFRPSWVLGATLALAATLGPVSIASAQNDPLIDDILKSLLEAEQSRLNNQQLNPNIPTTINPATLAIKDPRQLNTLLKEFSSACSELAMSLYNDVNRVPGVRPLLIDVYKLRARSSLLADKTSQGDAWKTLIGDVQSLDADWRVLSFKLAQVPNISQTQKRLMTRLDTSTASIGTLLKSSPQLNYYELMQATATLNVDFDNLLDDIEIEFGNTDSSRMLLIEGGKIQQQVRQIGELARNQMPHDRIVEAYGLFTQRWEPMMISLRNIDSRYIERSVRRIGESTRTMNELLWMPQELDRQKLIYVTSLLKKDVDEFFSRTPLKLLISLPNSQYVLSTADQFYGVCENFNDLVERNQNMNELVDAFRYIEQSEEEFKRLFKPIRSQAAVTVLTSIERHLGELRTAMSLNDSFDRQQIIDLAAKLENLTENLHLNTRIWMNRAPLGNRDVILAATSKFETQSAALHSELFKGTNLSNLRTMSNDLYDTWRMVHGYISQSTGDDRLRLAQLAAQIGPTLVEIRTLVEQ